jgi:hypothetical protein
MMVVVMAVMMIGRRISRYYGTGKNDEGNNCSKQ